VAEAEEGRLGQGATARPHPQVRPQGLGLEAEVDEAEAVDHAGPHPRPVRFLSARRDPRREALKERQRQTHQPLHVSLVAVEAEQDPCQIRRIASSRQQHLHGPLGELGQEAAPGRDSDLSEQVR